MLSQNNIERIKVTNTKHSPVTQLRLQAHIATQMQCVHSS